MDQATQTRLAARIDEPALAALFDLGYHTRHVDRIFDRVFGAAAED